jgi:2-methylisocitrate lyase-like PEP mutase family enzyme
MGHDQRAKAEAFRALHEGEPFLIPNPWDAGSARVLEGLGFKALATTSSGFAMTLGRLDMNVTLDELAAHVRSLTAASSLPVSVDLENGFGPDPSDTAHAIERAAEAGAVGGSIEDWDSVDGSLYEPAHATERVAAAVEAARALPFPFTLTARAENHIRKNPDLDDTIARLQAYEGAGADVLYAPGIVGEQINAVSDATGKPLNVLARPGMKVDELVAAGAQRISVGGGLAWVAVDALAKAAKAIQETGDFHALEVDIPLTKWLAA